MSVGRRLIYLLILPVLLQIVLVGVLLVLDDKAARSAQQAREQATAIHIIDGMIVDFGLALVAVFTRVTRPGEQPENSVITPEELRKRFVADAHKPSAGLIEADTYQRRFLAQISELRAVSGNDPASLASVDKAEKTVRAQYRLLKSMESSPAWQESSPISVLQKIGAMQKSVRSMLTFFEQFKMLSEEKYAKEQILLKQESEQRLSIRTFIIFILGFEAIAALVAVLLFGKNLTDRLKQLVSNADCLPQLGELPFKVQGKDEIAHLDNVLHQASSELRASTAVKTNLLNMVAHDIRSPVMAAKLSLMKFMNVPTGESAENQKVHGERLLRIFSTISVLVEDLLTFQKLDNSKIDLNFQKIFLDQLIQETIEEVRPLAQEKEIELKAESSPSIAIICDGVRVGQVLRNYLANAIKFSSTNSNILVKINEESDLIRVSVVDEGRGISDLEKRALFEQFTQSTTDDAKLGFGLGLHICKTIIDLHGGEVGVNSSPNEGSTFWFTLPKDEEPN